MLRARDPYTYGNFEVGDEHGVQGRFQKFFGDVLNTIFTSQSTTQRNIDLHFADFKCVSSTYSGTPDVILKDSNNALKIVGELKAPWIDEHHIGIRLPMKAFERDTGPAYHVYEGSGLHVRLSQHIRRDDFLATSR
jgi:hypothetical protein